jgi:hypothetical protein
MKFREKQEFPSLSIPLSVSVESSDYEKNEI